MSGLAHLRGWLLRRLRCSGRQLRLVEPRLACRLLLLGFHTLLRLLRQRLCILVSGLLPIGLGMAGAVIQALQA